MTNSRDNIPVPDEPLVADVERIPQFQIRRTRLSELYSTTMQKVYRPVYNKGRIVHPPADAEPTVVEGLEVDRVERAMTLSGAESGWSE